MKDDTISRKAAIKAAEKLLEVEHGIWERVVIADAVTALCGYLMDLPAAQPQRMRGRWIGIIGNAVKCDQCGRFNRRSNYCPNCGARMDGGQDED